MGSSRIKRFPLLLSEALTLPRELFNVNENLIKFTGECPTLNDQLTLTVYSVPIGSMKLYNCMYKLVFKIKLDIITLAIWELISHIVALCISLVFYLSCVCFYSAPLANTKIKDEDATKRRKKTKLTIEKMKATIPSLFKPVYKVKNIILARILL